MLKLNAQSIKQALVDIPVLNTQLTLNKVIEKIDLHDTSICIQIKLGGYIGEQEKKLKISIENKLHEIHPSYSVEILIKTEIQPHKTQNIAIKNHPQIKNVIAVGSGKGGVGKSTIALNLALALSQLGAQVGILDADIYGPSLPILLGHHEKPILSENQKKIEPVKTYNLQSISIGYLIDQSQAAIWRGPMVTQALKQLFFDTNWQNLDYLIIDLPPGTGDIQLTLAQNLPITGSITVYTPQKLARADAIKSLNMFNQLKILNLGLIENMAGFICPNCQKNTPIFTPDQNIQLHAKQLGQIPIDPLITKENDNGTPTLIQRNDHPISQTFTQIAINLGQIIANQPKDENFSMPEIKINPKNSV